jgi:heptosyltransferase-2
MRNGQSPPDQSKRSEHRSFSPWRASHPPRRALVIRFHAVGDVALVLPAAVHLSRRWPGTEIDILTCSPADTLAKAIPAFHNVLTLPQGSGRLMRVFISLRTGLSLRRRKYDIVLDLQRNYISRIIRLISGAPCWSEFDRFSPLPAPFRVLSTISRAGVTDPAQEIPVPFSEGVSEAARCMLTEEGWDGSTKLVVFNPAGLWETRNWPLSSYVELYRLWSMREQIRILILGTGRVKEKGAFIGRESGSSVINLAGRTTAGEAFAILRHAALIVTEDSGLMHMAWAAGVPIVALFGSSRNDWSAPQGENAVCMDSSDLECGCCMEAACRFGDVHCLTRHSPEAVLEAALGLTGRVHAQSQLPRS